MFRRFLFAALVVGLPAALHVAVPAVAQAQVPAMAQVVVPATTQVAAPAIAQAAVPAVAQEPAAAQSLGSATTQAPATTTTPRPFQAQREVRLVCGFAPGGTCDLLSRLLADQLTPVLGQRVVVENRTGASGMLAGDAVARAAPDGHTMLLMPMALASVLPVTPGMRMPFNPDRDLTPVSSLANVYNLLVVSPGSAFRSVADIIAAARAAPGTLSYASTGSGTSQHLSGELFQRLTGVQMLHVPFRGGAPAMVEITAGRVDMMFGNMPEFLGQIRDGGLRALAYGAPRASPLLPNLPVIGATLPGFEIRSWFGIAGPANMADTLVQGWLAALQQVGGNADFQRRMAENAMEITIDDPGRFRSVILEDRARWAEVIRAANIRAD